MKILLPPSEGKTLAPDGRPPVNCAELVFPQLGPVRHQVGDALRQFCGRPDALTVLGVGQRLAGEVARTAALWEEPAWEARNVYTGVLFAAAGLADDAESSDAGGVDAGAANARADELTWAQQHILISSALWGWVRPNDAIPAYRCSLNVDLPGVGPLGVWWKPHLGFMTEECAGQLVVDCRSGLYQRAWLPSWRECQDANIDVVEIKAVRFRKGESRPVTHNVKQWRGAVVKALMKAGASGMQPIVEVGELVEILPTVVPGVQRVHCDGGQGRWVVTVVAAG